MSTWSLTEGGQDHWLGRTSCSRQVRVSLRSSPETTPKSVHLHALAKHLQVRQHDLKL